MRKNRSESINYKDIENRIMAVKDLETYLSVVLYGRAGTGKTTLACDFPGPVLLLDINDKGTDSVNEKINLDVLQCEEWVDIEQTYWYLKKNPKKFKTVVLDTVSMMQDLALAHILEGSNRETGSLLHKKDWGEASSLLKTWIMNYRDLKMNVVFIAQDRISHGEEESEDTDGQIMPEVGPRLMPSVASTVNAAVSIVGNTFIQEKVRKIKTEDKKIIERREIAYCLRIGAHAYYTTKVRKPKAIEVPAYIKDPTYEKLIANLKE